MEGVGMLSGGCLESYLEGEGRLCYGYGEAI